MSQTRLEIFDRRYTKAGTYTRSGRYMRDRAYSRFIQNQTSEQAVKPLPYWAHYLLRTFFVLFLLLVFYLFGLCNPKGQQQAKEFIKTEFNNNATLTEAYDTYKDMDYGDMLTQLRTYVKAQLN